MYVMGARLGPTPGLHFLVWGPMLLEVYNGFL